MSVPARSRPAGTPSGAAPRRAGRAQHTADRGFRHPGRGGDPALPRPCPSSPGSAPPCGVQPRGSPRALSGRDQARDPAGRQRPLPPPHAHRDHPERLRHLRLGRGPQLPQLHRRQPPPGLVPRVPRERGQPVHPHHPAAVRAGDHAQPGAISAASRGSSGNGTWVSIRAIIPPPPAAANLSSIIAEM